jgi:hypothetical protein
MAEGEIMLTINLSDGVVAGLRLCKSSLEESVKLVMNSSTIEVSKIQAVDILEELRYTATLCYEQGYYNGNDTDGRYCP